MSPGTGTSVEARLEGERYNARHEVWEIAHGLGSPIYTLRRSLILKLLPREGEPLCFLDVGCGTGDYARALLEWGHRVDAIDISESAVQKAVERIPESLRSRFHPRVGDFSLLGQQARYGGIVCSEVLEHVRGDEPLLRQLHALLFPQGILVLSVPADPSLWSDDDVFSGHFRRYTREDLVAKLIRAGFTIEDLWSYGFPVLRIYIGLKMRWLGGKSAQVMVRNQRGTGRWAVRLLALIINAMVWLVDRRFLHTDRGIGFVVRCQKA